MITLIKTPSKVSLAEIPVFFGFRSDNYLQSAGSRAELILSFDVSYSNQQGQYFRLAFNQQISQFSAAQTPDNSGLQYPLPTISDTNTSWAKKIKEALEANYELQKYYDLSYTPGMVKIIAKQPGTAWDITVPFHTTPYLNPYTTLGTNRTLRPFFRVMVQIFSGNDLLGEDIVPVDSNGEAMLDISEYLRDRSVSSFTYPENSANVLNKNQHAPSKFRIRYGEFYTDPGQLSPRAHRMHFSPEYYALSGGISAMLQVAFQNSSTSFWAQQGLHKRWLTWAPNNSKVAKDDPIKLYGIISGSHITSVSLKVRYHYYDTNGASHTAVILKETDAGTIFDLFEACVGFKRLGLDTIEAGLPSGSSIYKYEVWLVSNLGAQLTEIRTYFVDDIFWEDKRTFLVRNSFGCWDIMTFHGKSTIEAGYTRQNYLSTRGHAINVNNPDVKVLSVLETEKHACSSGWMESTSADYYRELFLSRQVFELKNGTLIPVIINTESAVIATDGALSNIEFQYSKAFSDEHYSADLPVIQGTPVVTLPATITISQLMQSAKIINNYTSWK